MDGTKPFAEWLNLSWDHLLPKGHANRNNPDYIVTACMFCNTADNWYFRKAEQYNLTFDDMTPEKLVAQRKKYVDITRNKYEEFWLEHIQKSDDDKA